MCKGEKKQAKKPQNNCEIIHNKNDIHEVNFDQERACQCILTNLMNKALCRHEQRKHWLHFAPHYSACIFPSSTELNRSSGEKQEISSLHL